jgi:hypothetical protein
MSIIEEIIRQNTNNPIIKMEKKNTIFCDIDGTLFKYRKFETYETSTPELLDGVKEKLDCWCNNGHMIILTTARPEYLREHTEKELAMYHLPYSRLIMEIERGPRVLINDMDPGKRGDRAIGVNLLRDCGLGSVYWDDYEDMGY